MELDFEDSIRMRGSIAERVRWVLDATPGLRWRSMELVDAGPHLEAAIVVDAGLDSDLRAALAGRIRHAVPELSEVRVTAGR